MKFFESLVQWSLIFLLLFQLLRCRKHGTCSQIPIKNKIDMTTKIKKISKPNQLLINTGDFRFHIDSCA